MCSRGAECTPHFIYYYSRLFQIIPDYSWLFLSTPGTSLFQLLQIVPILCWLFWLFALFQLLPNYADHMSKLKLLYACLATNWCCCRSVQRRRHTTCTESPLLPPTWCCNTGRSSSTSKNVMDFCYHYNFCDSCNYCKYVKKFRLLHLCNLNNRNNHNNWNNLNNQNKPLSSCHFFSDRLWIIQIIPTIARIAIIVIV